MKATKTSKATIKRWKKDPDFLNMMQGRGLLTLGRVQVHAAESDVLEQVPCEESWLWIGDGSVLGSLLVDGATHLRAVFITAPERVQAVRDSLEQKLVPVLSGERTCVLAPGALSVLQDDPVALDLLTRICTADPAEAFAAFLSVWHFRAQETKDVRVLGADLWDAQETFVQKITEHEHVFALKARKLGQSTIACAFDAYVLRFRDTNARVHLFSRRERAALELLAAVRFGLERLPSWLRLPARTTVREIELDAGRHDRRIAVCYPTTDDTAVEATATHTHIDEWADMPNPDRVYQALEPTFTAPGCTSLIVTTGAGPANPSADYWRRCLAGEGLHHPLFIAATARPDRDQAWLTEKRRTILPDAFAVEYALTWQEAIAGTGGYVFLAAEIEAATTDARELVPHALRGRKYVIGVDVGSRQDHTVITCLDVTEKRHHVACYHRLKGEYPQLQKAITDMRQAFPSALVCIEENSVGAAVADNLNIPAQMLRRFTTSKASKERIIEALRQALQLQLLRWQPSLSQLTAEMRDYQLPDDNVVQDSVLSLAIALAYAAEAQGFQAQGRIDRDLFRQLNPWLARHDARASAPPEPRVRLLNESGETVGRTASHADQMAASLRRRHGPLRVVPDLPVRIVNESGRTVRRAYESSAEPLAAALERLHGPLRIIPD